ncbi:MAG: hypothetical protein RMH97_10275, partial [Verrucomicrobiales bacterium]|nr:hypothetical protein [Verrucomicrobiales bacterium]
MDIFYKTFRTLGPLRQPRTGVLGRRQTLRTRPRRVQCPQQWWPREAVREIISGVNQAIRMLAAQRPVQIWKKDMAGFGVPHCRPDPLLVGCLSGQQDRSCES